MKLRSTLLGAFGAAAVVTAVGAQVPRNAVDYQITLATKVLCSAVFVSARDPVEAMWNSAHLAGLPKDEARLVTASDPAGSIHRYRLDRTTILRFTAPRLLPDPERYQDAALEVRVNRRNGTVAAQVGEHRAKSRFWGDQGCVAQEADQDSVHFVPVRVTTGLPPAASEPWPRGDRVTTEPASPRASAVARAIDLAFADGAYTMGVVVVHGGEVVAERYAEGITPETQLESWSMGKSVTATLIGLLVAEGRLRLDQPAPVPLWQVRNDDPRRQITVGNLLQMSSGLRFSNDEPAHTWSRIESDHLYVYSGLANVFEHAVTQPPEFPPNTVGRYRNSDPLTLGFLIRQAVEQSGRDYLTWPQRALFDRIGVRRQVLETDRYGNFVLTGFDYGTPRNWARLGLLYLRDGVWLGERLLPAGFVEFVRTPAPAWPQPVYGGQFWLNGDCVPERETRSCRNPNQPPSRPEFAARRWNLPGDAYLMAGAGGQYVFIVPSLDLVVVRMGHRRGQVMGDRSLNQALGQLVEVLQNRPSDGP